MQVVGSMALDVTRMPGPTLARLAGCLATALSARTRQTLTRLAYEVVAALRARGPALVALLTSVRVRSRPASASQNLVVSRTTSIGSARAGRRGEAAPDGAPAGGASGHRELVLPADPTAPGRARALLRAAAEEWKIDDGLCQDAAMVVTELVANAVDHARTPSTLTVRVDDEGLHVAVRDGRTGPAPELRPIDAGAPRGRGLQMVDALSARWGVTQHADGKTVWAVLEIA
jgi:anti-sigma regulatory factor (Ser/Thr protein kinase)